MNKKIADMMQSRFTKVWVSLLVLTLVLVGARYTFFSQPQAPSLEQVLLQENVPAHKNSQDLSMLIASLVAFSLAALSMAKGVEMVRKNHPVTAAVLAEEKPQVVVDFCKDREIEELAQIKRALMEQNSDLRNQIRRHAQDLDEIKKVEGMLRKSNISLSRECERLKAENEELVLKVNSVVIRTEPAAPVVPEAPEEKPKAKRTVAAKKVKTLKMAASKTAVKGKKSKGKK